MEVLMSILNEVLKFMILVAVAVAASFVGKLGSGVLEKSKEKKKARKAAMVQEVSENGNNA